MYCRKSSFKVFVLFVCLQKLAKAFVQISAFFQPVWNTFSSFLSPQSWKSRLVSCNTTRSNHPALPFQVAGRRPHEQLLYNFQGCKAGVRQVQLSTEPRGSKQS